MGVSIQLWLTEIAALTASTLLILSLIIVLTVYDGKTVFSWHGVTLNAIVSILATSSKASMLLAVEELISQWKWILFHTPRTLWDFERIDSASRGPLGSLAVMWCCKKMSPLHIGAWVVLLSLAIDPFSQQLVQTRLYIR
ncbi:hypothetical protein GGR58DRAFT_504911 [Xylaria digitata]|nr:hypothetical protein GGR58DRAFT_504911 [Xylaria digitata]